MMRSTSAWVSLNCARTYSLPTTSLPKSIALRTFSSYSPLAAGKATSPSDEDEDAKQNGAQEEEGAMSRRLAEMAEETMDTGSKSDRKLMQDAGFSEELKRKLEERIEQTVFLAENQQAFSEADMPSFAGKGTRDQAAAQPWTGNESLHDSALRMLDDSHKRIRGPAARTPRPIGLKPLPKEKPSTGQRLANARDKTSVYALAQQMGMTEEEREKMRKELKERFSPAARPMPATLQGLTSLANERIEDAIARGQFRNIPRGKGMNVERDYNANSPFIDTTEYFMNKIIQKQEIVPPWIEKQQELVKLVSHFRSRLRSDWKRHAARSIASKGGSLDEQIRRAQAFALAEERHNPIETKLERLSEINSDGTLSTVTVMERPPVTDGRSDSQTTITVTETLPEDAPSAEDGEPKNSNEASAHTSAPYAHSSKGPPMRPMAYPFRDSQWERAENAYHTLAINELNNLTRSYNLMAPKIAQKPYYTLSRELERCFADVAPLLADEIGRRARAPKVRMEVIGHREGGIMEKFGAGHVAKVRDEDVKKGYGFKEFWRDLFRREEGVKV